MRWDHIRHSVQFTCTYCGRHVDVEDSYEEGKSMLIRLGWLLSPQVGWVCPRCQRLKDDKRTA
jgi:hypothetical protein